MDRDFERDNASAIAAGLGPLDPKIYAAQTAREAAFIPADDAPDYVKVNYERNQRLPRPVEKPALSSVAEQIEPVLPEQPTHDENGVPFFDNWLDHDLLVFIATRMYTASNTIEEVATKVTPAMEKFQKGGILGMLKGGL